MKTLLLSDIPPCKNYTGGVVLADEIRLLEVGSLVAFIVLNEELNPEPAEDLEWLTTYTAKKPSEHGTTHGSSVVAAAIREFYNASVVRRDLVKQAVAFGRSHGCDRVWAVLEGQTVIRMAEEVARKLGVPLVTQVWDPPSWWLKAHNVDPINSVRILKHYNKAVRGSVVCGVASQAMGLRYQKQYNVETIPLISSYPASVVKGPRENLRDKGKITIGMIGQFYAKDAWDALLEGLRSSNWCIDGRDVDFYYLGASPPSEIPENRITFGGWKPPLDAISLLHDNADVCYCPYPFSESMREVAELSFPSKAIIYLASGVPMVCHGPLYSSPSQYFMKNRAAVNCGDVHPLSIVGLIRWLCSHSDVYSATSRFGLEAFLSDFTTERLKTNLLSMLNSDR